MSGMLRTSATLTHPKIEVARALVPSLRDQAEVISEQRQVPAELIARLSSEGLLGLLRPAAYGGDPVPMDVAFEVARELAQGDGSVGWVHAVLTSHEQVIGMFADDVQAEYWSSSDLPLSASSYIPSGKATKATGGFRLSGKWSFCSGIDHANWIVVGAVAGVVDGEVPRPDVRLFLMPRADFGIVDDWHVMGLRGTGSKSIVVDNVFVADDRIIRIEDVGAVKTPGALTSKDVTFRYSTWSLLGFSLSGVATGIARNAYQAVTDQCRTRTGMSDPMFEKRRPAIAMHLAKAEALIDASDLIYMRALKETFALVEAEGELSIAQRIRNRRDQCYSVSLAREAADILLCVGGARNIREGAVVQRAFRDLCAVALHPGTNWDSVALDYGAFILGTELNDPFL